MEIYFLTYSKAKTTKLLAEIGTDALQLEGDAVDVLSQRSDKHQSVDILLLALRRNSTVLVLAEHRTAVKPDLHLSNHVDGSCTIEGGEQAFDHPVGMLL